MAPGRVAPANKRVARTCGIADLAGREKGGYKTVPIIRSAPEVALSGDEPDECRLAPLCRYLSKSQRWVCHGDVFVSSLPCHRGLRTPTSVPASGSSQPRSLHLVSRK